MNSPDIQLNLDNYCLFLYIFKALDTINHRAQEKAYDLLYISLRKIFYTKKQSANKRTAKGWAAPVPVVERVREATRSPDLSGFKCTPEVSHVVSLRLCTAWFSVPFGPCKDKTQQMCEHILLSLLFSSEALSKLVFPRNTSQISQVAEGIHSTGGVKNCRLLDLFANNLVP